jgi:pimeloyl-ACP methyl ester carboxylesterase
MQSFRAETTIPRFDGGVLEVQFAMSTINFPLSARNSRSIAARRSFAPALLFLLALLLSVSVIGIRVFQPDLQSAAILMQLNGDRLPWLLRAVDSDPISVQDVTLPGRSGPLQGRLFTPAHHPNAPGILIVHGCHHSGMNDPRLVDYARSMSAAGLRVLTPEIPGLDSYNLGPQAVTAIGDAAHWFALQTGQPVALLGMSFGGGLALVAAARPEYAADIKVILAIGAFDDLYRVTNAYATAHTLLPDGRSTAFDPSSYGQMVLEYQYFRDFAPPVDYAPLHALLQARLYDRNAEWKNRLAGMSPPLRREAALLLDRDRMAPAMASVARQQRAALESISPHGHLSGLRAPVYLLCGVDDPIIPTAEAQWLARDLPPGALQEELTSPTITHVAFGNSSHSLADKWRIVHLLARVLKAAQASQVGSA